MSHFQAYRRHRFNSKARVTVDQANAIIEEMQAQGYTLTLRQLYYQFVARDLMPNKDREYKRLGRLMTLAREAGETDWYAIEDAGRQSWSFGSQEDPASVVHGLEGGIHFDQWARQDHYLEVWVEKQALEGVIERPSSRWLVPYMACKGYLSASEAWRAGRRFQNALQRGKKPVLLHLADHDPSGLNMTDDNATRLQLFAEDEGFDIDVRRLALNMDQIEEYKPPPNPAKETDSRAKGYVQKYGTSSWELDALRPQVIDKLIDDTINEYRDPEVWREVQALEDQAKEPLVRLSEGFDSVQDFLASDEDARMEAIEALDADLPLRALLDNWPRVEKFMKKKDMI